MHNVFQETAQPDADAINIVDAKTLTEEPSIPETSLVLNQDMGLDN